MQAVYRGIAKAGLNGSPGLRGEQSAMPSPIALGFGGGMADYFVRYAHHFDEPEEVLQLPHLVRAIHAKSNDGKIDVDEEALKQKIEHVYSSGLDYAIYLLDFRTKTGTLLNETKKIAQQMSDEIAQSENYEDPLPVKAVALFVDGGKADIIGSRDQLSDDDWHNLKWADNAERFKQLRNGISEYRIEPRFLSRLHVRDIELEIEKQAREAN